MIRVEVILPEKPKKPDRLLPHPGALVKLAGEKQRDMATDFPEFELWEVTVNYGNGRFKVKNGQGLTMDWVRALDHRARHHLHAGCVVVVGFEKRDRAKPYIKGLYGIGPEYVRDDSTAADWGWLGRTESAQSYHPSNNLRVDRQRRLWNDFGAGGGLGFDGPMVRIRSQFHSGYGWDFTYDFGTVIDGGGATWLRKNGWFRIVADIGSEAFPSGFAVDFTTEFATEFITDVTLESDVLYFRTVRDDEFQLPSPYVGIGVRNIYSLWRCNSVSFPTGLEAVELGRGGYNPDLFDGSIFGAHEQSILSENPRSDPGFVTPSKLCRMGIHFAQFWFAASEQGSSYLSSGITRHLLKHHVIVVDGDTWTASSYEIGEFSDLQDGSADGAQEKILGFYNLSDSAMVAYGIPTKMLGLDPSDPTNILWTLGSNTDTLQQTYDAILKVGSWVLCRKTEDRYESYETVDRPSPGDFATLTEANIEDEVAYVLATYNVPETRYYLASRTRSYVLVDQHGQEVGEIPVRTTGEVASTTTYRTGAEVYQMTAADTDRTRIVQSWWQAKEYRYAKRMTSGAIVADAAAGDYFHQVLVSGGFAIPDFVAVSAADGSPDPYLHNPAGGTSGWGGLIPFGVYPVIEDGPGVGNVPPSQLHDRIDYGTWTPPYLPVDYPQKRWPLPTIDTSVTYPIDGDANVVELILECRYLSSATIGYNPGEEQTVRHYAFDDPDLVWAASSERLVSVTVNVTPAPATVTVRCYKIAVDGELSQVWVQELKLSTVCIDARVIIAKDTIGIFIDFAVSGKLRFFQLRLSSGTTMQVKTLEDIGVANGVRLPEIAFDGTIITIGDTAFGRFA